jgi:hypothetical protein
MKNITVLFVSLILLISCSTNKNIPTPITSTDEVMEDTLIFVVDTTYNPRETFYILTNGTIVNGIEFDKIFKDAWNKTFGNLTEEEKKLLLIDNFKISFDTLNQK